MQVTMVNKRGRVMHVNDWEVDNLKSQGCKIVINPRGSYLPEYDEDSEYSLSKAGKSSADTIDGSIENVTHIKVIEV